jgi:nitrogen fixation/metabolism regulation signal transduction histidine kinase
MLADALGDAVVAVDADGTITYANAAAARMFDAAAGKQLRELVGDGPWQTRERVARAESLAMLRGVPRVIADTTTPLDAGGAVIAIRDITEHAIAKRRAALAEQLAQSGIARATVAHQVNNPLAVIFVHAEMLRDELERVAQLVPSDASRIRSAATSSAELEKAASSIRAMMGDLRAFSQPATGEGEATVQRAVDYAVRTTSAQVRERARIFTHVELAEPIAIDDSSLGHILVQLIANAAEAIEPGGADRNEIRVDVRRESGRALVEIRDTGRGIDVMPDGPVLRATPLGIHVGLGLVRCRELVARVGGTVELGRAPSGAGALARVTLPLVRAVAAKSRVLIVDPDAAYVRSVRRVLRDHDVASCATTDEALAELAKDARFDVLLVDVSADLTGAALFRRIAADYPALARRVVFVSAADSEPAVADFLAAATNRVLEKPIDAAVLRELVT